MAVLEVQQDDVWTEEATRFVAALVERHAGALEGLMLRRRERQRRFDAGELPDFLPETRAIREAIWSVAPPPKDLEDRRVEITGPVDRKMVINALNSGAQVFMADFEDSHAPTWAGTLQGQRNLREAVRRTLTHDTPSKVYRLVERPAVLVVRPRGLHLQERHVRVDGGAAPGALVDFGLYAIHNARELVARGTGPYFYLPKLESHLEARWWNDVLTHAESLLGLPLGTMKVTVLIETLTAAFEMDEILWELRPHVVGLNCGRWDYMFSVIKKLRAHPGRVLPDRSLLTMDGSFLRAYSRLLVQTCHRRGAHAMGGMAAQIPIKDDPVAHEAAMAKVRADKLREVRDGHDGTWVAHPGLVPVARAVFDAHMPGPNQKHVTRADVVITRADLLDVPAGARTEAGLRQNLRVGVLYLEAWLRGVGCVPIDHLMEDAATAEISRAQVWQWLHFAARLDDTGAQVDLPLFRRLLDEEVARIGREVGKERTRGGRLAEAAELYARLSTSPTFDEFLTLQAYDALVRHEAEGGLSQPN